MKAVNYLVTHNKFMTLIISAVALMISILSINQASTSNDLAQKAYALAKVQDSDEKSLVLFTDFTNSDDLLRLSPVNQNNKLSSAEVIYPSYFYGVPTKAMLPEFEISIVYLKQKLYEFSANHRDEDKLKIKEGCVPIIINAEYVSKGNVMKSSGLYLLQYQITIDSKKPQLKDFIYFRGIKLVKFLVGKTHDFENWEEQILNCSTN